MSCSACSKSNKTKSDGEEPGTCFYRIDVYKYNGIGSRLFYKLPWTYKISFPCLASIGELSLNVQALLSQLP